MQLCGFETESVPELSAAAGKLREVQARLQQFADMILSKSTWREHSRCIPLVEDRS
jgi:hypothetical protein